MPIDEEDESVFIHREPCPQCGSRDNLARYSDGHAYCFGCEHREPPSEEFLPSTQKRKGKRMADGLIDNAKHRAISSRKISEETVRRFDYRVAKRKGEIVHVANYRDKDGAVTAQHLRTQDKDFPWLGETKGLQLFGQHAARDGAPKVIITEGELDAMSVHEIISAGRNSRWAAVSVYRGAKSAKKDIAENLPWLEKADEVILMFDNDEHGEAAAAECARLFSPGRCKIARLPLKDASDMLVSGRSGEVIDAIFGAKEWRPEGVVRVSDLRENVLTDPVVGLPWWHPGINAVLLGRRTGELDGLGAGTGVGKSDFLTQQIEYDINTLQIPVGLFMLEQHPSETIRRITGKMAGRKFHIPPAEDDAEAWTMDELTAAVDELEKSDRLFLFDHFGSQSYDQIEETIRFLRHAHDVQHFYLDHLTALAAQEDDERKALEQIMARLGGLVKELDIWVGFVSHLTTPDTGPSHEEGGRVTIRQFKGSRAIGFWSHHMFGMERDQQAECEIERSTTTFRILKDRVTGQGTGLTFNLGYDHETARLTETAIESSSSFGAIDGADSTIF